MIFQLIYTCALRNDVSLTEFDKMARELRVFSLDNDLTGIAICKDYSILHVLEGDKAIVNTLFNRVSKDPRVKNSLVLIRRTSTQREFSGWSMGYKDASTDAASFELTANSFSSAMPDRLSPEITTIGRTFARVNGLT